MRFVGISLAVHAAVLWLFAVARDDRPTAPPPHVPDQTRTEPAIDTPIEAILIETDTGGGGQAASVAARSSPRPAPRTSRDAWERVRVSIEPLATGQASHGELGAGAGGGLGDGRGIGIGTGRGIRVPDPLPAVPAPPPPPVASKARAARLIYPRRDLPVEDDADLFVARITVDEDGDVVGARMIKTRPGSRGDQAASAIWQFRYAPALDDRGTPIRSTFEQRYMLAP